jgi:NAD(P)H-hydrate repair Nnr-like enzyme with NAD(P)H-hydrate epimerase domain
MRVVTVTEMREIEQRAEAEHGLTSEVLMEHAGAVWRQRCARQPGAA